MVRHRRSTTNTLAEDTIQRQTEYHGPPPPKPVRRYRLNMMQSLRKISTNKAVAIAVAFVLSLAWLLLIPHKQGSFTASSKPSSSNSNPQFHLLLPASSSNRNFCRLLLSSIILNYPVPVLINWDAHETGNAFDMHLLKISKVLEYLEQFPPEKADDLVLMVDAYDVWFQLPPETIIRRYYEQVQADEAYLAKKHGAATAREKDFRNTVIFSNDKLCWPEEGIRPACWVLPESPLAKYTYGPSEDVTREEIKYFWDPYRIRARFLNSGSIMGPVRDMKKVFQAVAIALKKNPSVGSDQFHFAEVWASQEYARWLEMQNKTQIDGSTRPDYRKEIPDLESLGGQEEPEMHMTLDYENALFQPIGYFDPSLSFVQLDGSLQAGRPKDAPIPYSDVHELEADIVEARPPLHALTLPKSDVPDAPPKRMRGWDELPLLTNLLTKHATPIIHFMVEKEYRIKWWDRMWYAPFSRDLFEASRNAPELPILSRPVGGNLWTNANKPVVETNVDAPVSRAGAWGDKGSWLSWNHLCLEHEEYIFTADRSEAYHRPG